MKQKMLQAAMVLIFLCGLGVFLYPKITEWYAAEGQQRAMEEFKEVLLAKEAETLQADENGNEDDIDEKLSQNLEQLYQDMQEYNERIYREGQENLKDPFDYENPSFDLTEYGFEKNVIGIIHIPAMEVKLPLYLGANTENMKKGAVIMGETSMPLGGENTNVVVAAHRGYQGTPMFREIEILQPGDKIEVTTPFEILTYQVTETKVVLPNEINEILIEEGKDKITLLTCHPYTQNTHRYLVYGERCENMEESSEQEQTPKVTQTEVIEQPKERSVSEKQIWLETYVPFVGVGVIVLLIVCGVLLTRKRK